VLVVHGRARADGNGRGDSFGNRLSAVISKELKRRGFKFVGPTIVYAWMQAVGIVNDHASDCFRRKVASRSW
jgi:DNA-3-methyladenine glycosylase I